MVWAANQAIRSAVGLPFEIVKVLQQDHSCWTKSTRRRSGLLERRKHSGWERQAAAEHRERNYFLGSP
jgi:hypothetical protein